MFTVQIDIPNDLNSYAEVARILEHAAAIVRGAVANPPPTDEIPLFDWSGKQGGTAQWED